MTRTIRGSFQVKLAPQSPQGDAETAAAVGRMSIDKQFSGPLEASSLGQMLAVRTEVTGSAGYVALERVTARLEGRSGAFYLQHSGSMDRGEKSLTIQVVPDSGSGELTGLRGKMDIEITEGQHFYLFEYDLPDDSRS